MLDITTQILSDILLFFNFSKISIILIVHHKFLARSNIIAFIFSLFFPKSKIKISLSK
jgi:hypothetical protein